jgi:ATP-dependent RNA helicase DDX5/DBP2
MRRAYMRVALGAVARLRDQCSSLSESVGRCARARPQIRRIIIQVPTERQTLMFTATWPKAVVKLASEFLRSPMQVTVGDADTSLTVNRDIRQIVQLVPSAESRDGALIAHINTLPHGARVLIFCSTKRACDALSRAMARQIGCESIHGDKDQRERETALRDFRSGRSPILVATDVAARGLDIKDVALVINCTLVSDTHLLCSSAPPIH